VIHVNSRLRALNRERGYVDVAAIVHLAKLCVSIVRQTILQRPPVAYFPIGSNRTGFLRDAVVILVLKTTGRRIIAHYRGGHFGSFYEHSSRPMKWLIRTVLRQVDRLLVLGEPIKNSFAGIYPTGRDIAVLSNGIEVPDRSRDIEARWRGPFTIFYMGNLSFVKGFYDLIVTYKRLIGRFPDVRLLCAGEPIPVDEERNVLRAYFDPSVQKRMDRSTVEIREFLANPAAFNAVRLGLVTGDGKRAALARASVYVLPSYSEGFSMGVLEAMAAGVPIVTTNVGAMSEVVEDGVNGYVIRPGDCTALYDRLTALIADRDLCRRMGAASRTRVEARFDIERVVDTLSDLFIRTIEAR